MAFGVWLVALGFWWFLWHLTLVASAFFGFWWFAWLSIGLAFDCLLLVVNVLIVFSEYSFLANLTFRWFVWLWTDLVAGWFLMACF